MSGYPPTAQWYFPPPTPYQYPAPPPAPYMPPEYSQQIPLDPALDEPDTPAPPERSRKRATSAVSTTSIEEPIEIKRPRGRPPKPKPAEGTLIKSPPKRRGRPPGSGTKAAKAKAPSNKKPSKDEKENIPPPIDIVDSDDEIERTPEGKIKHWNTPERNGFYQFLLGDSDDAEKRFQMHSVHPARVYKKASDVVFHGSRSPGSIKSMWERSFNTFVWMRAFEKFTGNGGGDADNDDPEAILRKKLSAAWQAGLSLGSLKPATITEWETNGWFDLFNNRLGTSAKVTREVVRSSASVISDLDDNLDNDIKSDSDDDINIHSDLRKAPTAPKTPSATVSEPKHTPSSTFRKQATSSLGSIGEFMKMKMVAEEKKTGVLEAKLELEREKLELEKSQKKLEMAQSVLAMPGASAEVKEAANTFMLKLFS
ncbi:hypothetical protein C8R46DRAFT_1237967 [Mycena filopes]|nr:hypothetical protein C8R46DRAFT_1237967 [Mycena filopes]